MPQLTSFWELLQAKSKQVQKSPCRPKPQQTSSAESSLRQREQRRTEARPNPKAPMPVHRVLPKTKLSAAVPQAFASAQEDETMRANVKHRSAGKLLSRLSWPLHCQEQSSALPVRAAWISSPFPAAEGSALLPQIRGRWNLWQPFPMHSSPSAAQDRDGLSYICLCSTQLQQGAVDNYRNTRDKRKKNPNIPIGTALRRILPSNETANY